MAGNIDLFYQLIIQACNDNNIGYNQNQRRTIQLGVPFRTFCDCSSIESWGLTLSGFTNNNPWFTTYNMESYLIQWGWHLEPITGEWKMGDIVWKDGHTEVVYRGRVTMGAHTDSVAFANQVSINDRVTDPSYYTRLWRYQDGASGDEPKTNVSPYVASAIFGNWWRESTMNPGVWEGLIVGGNAGYGLGQWTGDRRTALFSYMEEHHHQIGDGDGQIDFFVEEDDWQASTSTPLHFDTLTDFLTSSSTDVDALTETFMNAWERPGVPALPDRIAFAHKALEQIQAHSGEHATWISSNAYLSEEQGMNNVLSAWNHLGILFPNPGGQGWSDTLRFGAARELYRRRYIWR